ncbi:hypothetical protein LTR37_002520 [Vermiconidia calcicola]|uniref:Uncharacterized protein n=1 Tax=Vermiconidia calcicola TaxID=1690605 RepID=A0ACC3NTS0_9PEZI|nr:hypothetical protein LTR37_002520 [Vermiconidia calcicola]
MRKYGVGLLLRQIYRTPTPTRCRKAATIPFRAMSTQHGPSAESIARLAARIPQGTWDTHMHVVDPPTFPLSKDAKYQVSPHTIVDAQKFLSSLGISKMVIVQPSIYGNDNACTIDGLKRLGVENGRAVIQFDADTTSTEQLQEWHELGVRGVRLNYKSVGAKPEKISLAAQMHKYATAVRPFGWVVELYIGMEDIPLLETIVPDLGDVKICIDHFGRPTQTNELLPGFSSLTQLLKLDNIWVKLSAAYRLDPDPQHPLVQSLARSILRTRPDRCVFATDWPHTRAEDVDVTLYLQELFNWCEAEDVPLRKILVENAEELFDAQP